MLFFPFLNNAEMLTKGSWIFFLPRRQNENFSMISQSYSFPGSWVNYKPCKNKEKKGKEINPDLELKWFIVKLQGTARTFLQIEASQITSLKWLQQNLNCLQNGHTQEEEFGGWCRLQVVWNLTTLLLFIEILLFYF